MGSRLLCWMLLCLLVAGLVEAEVTQTPRHLIKMRGQQVTLKCSPVSGHNSVYWYQQAPGQGPQFLFEYYNAIERQKGNFPDRFSGHQFSNSTSEMNVNALELGDSALYLCASSLAQPYKANHILCINLPGPMCSSISPVISVRTWDCRGKDRMFIAMM
uniref:Ig-like domain-containing protein n=2 Tax=Callithrix jacchus TaxID=9483 RepID=A0A5F4W1J3_CALJA